MKQKFPEIKCAKDEKRLRIIKCLEAEGIIQVKYRGRAGMYATHWSLGSEAKLALGVTDEAQEAASDIISQACPQPLMYTSTNYGSLFVKEGFLLQSGCKEVCSGINGHLSLSGGQPEQPIHFSTAGLVIGHSVKMPSVSRPLEVAPGER
jgi:hypothetical protein